MIKIDKGRVEVDGNGADLVIELALVITHIAESMAKKTDKEVVETLSSVIAHVTTACGFMLHNEEEGK